MAEKIASLYIKNLKGKTLAIGKSILGPNKGGLVHFYSIEQLRNAIRMEELNEVDIQTDIPVDIMNKLEKVDVKLQQLENPKHISPYEKTFGGDPDTLSLEVRGMSQGQPNDADADEGPDTLPLELRGMKMGYPNNADADRTPDTLPLEVRGSNLIPGNKANYTDVTSAEREAARTYGHSLQKSSNSEEIQKQQEEREQLLEETENIKSPTVADVVGYSAYKEDETRKAIKKAGADTVDEHADEEEQEFKEEQAERRAEDQQYQNHKEQFGEENETNESNSVESKELIDEAKIEKAIDDVEKHTTNQEVNEPSRVLTEEPSKSDEKNSQSDNEENTNYATEQQNASQSAMQQKESSTSGAKEQASESNVKEAKSIDSQRVNEKEGQDGSTQTAVEKVSEYKNEDERIQSQEELKEENSENNQFLVNQVPTEEAIDAGDVSAKQSSSSSNENEKPEWYLTYDQVEDMTKKELLEWAEKRKDLNIAKSTSAADTKEAIHEYLQMNFKDHA